MSDLSAVQGRSYGPFPVEVSSAKVAEFVAATGDDPVRWSDHAPPGFAASILFEAAPAFFADEVVQPFLAVLIHTEQRFEWPRTMPIGAGLEVTGTVQSVKQRAGLNLVSLMVEAVADGRPIVVSNSTFMMATEADIPASADEPEPDARLRRRNDAPEAVDLPDVGEALPPLHKSASRLDLVKYAAATGDFNPIHWDHDAARAAGLEGVVCHGLLMGSWAVQAAARASNDEHAPLENVRLRFRRPLRPAAAAVVAATVIAASESTVDLKLALSSEDVDLVAATATVRRRVVQE